MAEAIRTQKVRARAGSQKKQRERPLAGEELPDFAASTGETRGDDDSERVLARLFAVGVPAFGLGGALLVGVMAGIAPALLVLAGTSLVGTIGFFWASLRTLSGDAPLPEGVSMHSHVPRTPAPERKRETLRALKDLELEHSIGKIDDADYLELSTRYRATAKSLMREIDEGLAPRRKQAEELVQAHLAKRKVTLREEQDDSPQERPEPRDEAAPLRLECSKCSVSNEPDATFCKKCGSPLALPPTPTEGEPDASV